MSTFDPNFKGVCIGIAVALVIGVASGVWVVGIVIGIAVAASLSDRMRRRAAPLPPMVERGRKKRKSG